MSCFDYYMYRFQLLHITDKVSMNTAGYFQFSHVVSYSCESNPTFLVALKTTERINVLELLVSTGEIKKEKNRREMY